MTDYEKYTPDQWGFATFLIDQHSARLRYARDINRFYRFSGSHWQECGQSNVEIARVVNLTAEYIREHMPTPVSKESPEYSSWFVQAAFVKLAGTSGATAGVINKMREDARIWCKLDDFAGKPYLINFTDCTVDVRKPWMDEEGEIEAYVHAHRPQDMLSTALKFSYPEYNLQPTPLWDALLLHMCGGDASYAQSLEQALAYGMLGRNPEQLMVFLVGDANIGKTQALEIVTQLSGSLGGHGKVELIQYTRGQEHDSIRADLRGKHFVMLGETSHRLKLDEMKFKDLTGAESIPTRKLGQEPVDTRVTWTLYCATNELPDIPGEMDSAMARRLWLFPLPGKQVSRQDRDTALTEKIVQQEGPSVLYKLVRHLSEWYAFGKSPVQHARSVAALDRYRAESDTVADFANEMLSAQEGSWVSYSDLHTEYVKYCKSHNLVPVSKRQLPKRIEDVMMTPERDSKHMRLKGVAIAYGAPSWA